MRRILKRLKLLDAVRAVVRTFSNPVRKAVYDGPVARRYFRERSEPKLQVGSGTNLLEGWLNTHYHPGMARLSEARRRDRYLIHLDCGKPFPFPSDAFRYVYSEHMIEHIPYESAVVMMSECFRILQPGGVIRIATPDLDFTVGLFQRQLSEPEQQYVRAYTARHYPNHSFPHPAFVLNNIVRNWGHTFLYNEEVLRHVLESAGFVKIVRCAFSESEETALAGLETDERVDNRIESLTMEATKPA